MRGCPDIAPRLPGAWRAGLLVLLLGIGAPVLSQQAEEASAAQAQADTSPSAGALQAQLALRSIPEWHRPNRDGLLAPAAQYTGAGVRQADTQAEVRAERDQDGATERLVWTGSNLVQRGASPSRSGVLDEAFWEGGDDDWRLVAGKKVLSWDVGYGFRPLDVVERQDRRALYQFALEGVPLVAAERLQADASWMVVLAHPGSGMAGPDPAREGHDGSLAVRGYRRLPSGDLYLVGRVSRRDGLQLGSSVTQVVGEGFEWHASLLGQQRQGIALAQPLAGPAPLVPPAAVLSFVRRGPSAQALAGLNWANEDGWGLIAEAWYDGTSATRADARRLRGLEAEQSLGLADPAWTARARGALALDATSLTRANLVRDNLLLHLSRKVGSWTPAADLLATPGDGGIVATASFAYEGDRCKLEGALRLLAGRQDSIYRNLPEDRMGYLAASWYF